MRSPSAPLLKKDQLWRGLSSKIGAALFCRHRSGIGRMFIWSRPPVRSTVPDGETLLPRCQLAGKACILLHAVLPFATGFGQHRGGIFLLVETNLKRVAANKKQAQATSHCAQHPLSASCRCLDMNGQRKTKPFGGVGIPRLVLEVRTSMSPQQAVAEIRAVADEDKVKKHAGHLHAMH